jgi:uncharacterized protein involved in response to NO
LLGTGSARSLILVKASRATLGHTGRLLAASPVTQLIYIAVVVAMVARVIPEFEPSLMLPLLYVAAACWIAAFGGFALIYGPMLAK